MFCKNCGKQVPDTAIFCPGCGASLKPVSTPVEEPTPVVKPTPTPQPEPAPAVQPDPIPTPTVQPTPVINPTPVASAPVQKGPSLFSTMGKWLKAFFSTKIVSVLDDVAKDTTLTGFIGIIFEVVILMIYHFVLYARNISFSFLSFDIILRFVRYFVVSLFMPIFSIAALLGALCIVLAICHKKINIKSVLNIMFYALIPYTLIYFTAMIFSFIPFVGSTIASSLYDVGFVMAGILLYLGFQKLDTFNPSSFYIFILFGFVFFFVYIIIGNLFNVIAYNSIIEYFKNLFEQAFSGLNRFGRYH